ncbi:MAG: hypothetical protein WCF17_11000 [Terracidiphilus sp.]
MAHPSPSTNEGQAGGKIGRQGLLPWNLRPCALGFLALAFAIFLWGTAYKLSLYHVYPNHSVRVSEVRMWLETRSARTVTDVLRRVSIERPPGPSNLSAAGHQMYLVNLGPVEQNPLQLPLLGPVVPFIPARSPPPRRFCLA